MKVIIIAGLLTVSAAVSAEPPRLGQSKDWMWSADAADFYHAATVNSAGNVLGLYCYLAEDKCLYMVSLSSMCKAGSEYSALINSTVGAAPITLICRANQKAFVFKETTTIQDIILGATNIGIAISHANGDFAVSRFSLAGSTAAIARMIESVEKNAQPASANQSKPAFVRL